MGVNNASVVRYRDLLETPLRTTLPALRSVSAQMVLSDRVRFTRSFGNTGTLVARRCRPPGMPRLRPCSIAAGGRRCIGGGLKPTLVEKQPTSAATGLNSHKAHPEYDL